MERITFKVRDFIIGNGDKLTIIAGPCVIDTEKNLFETASKLKKITEELGINFIFKTSFDKANRMSIKSYRGPGIKEGLELLSELKKELNIPIVIDVHSVDQINRVAQIADVIQIPAFLCRQTDLIVSSAKTGLPLHIKKGQFMSPDDMGYIANKAVESGNNKVILCERGTFFGYHDLVVDFRSLLRMKDLGFPISFDFTHSLQSPGGSKGSSGGYGQYASYFASAGIMFDVDILFFETHPDPANSPSDSAVMVPLDNVKNLLSKISELYSLKKRRRKNESL